MWGLLSTSYMDANEYRPVLAIINGNDFHLQERIRSDEVDFDPSTDIG